MSYMALYRKFRPGGFDDVKGQDHIVTTLRNQVKADRVGHAYLFTGTRGTGKTSVAKILARAVNCEHPENGSPCGECGMCRQIADQTSLNVIEIDAASNNGVDNIREIIDEVQYSPTQGRYKVYIIDEVHMLSTGAFNALLKTLEEPPAYVMFILATTEVHKIPVTILSRCQRYDFHRITTDTITARLQELMEKEQVEYEEKALRYVAKAADGSLRDALSLLDECLAFHYKEVLTYDKVLDVLGAVDIEVFSKMLRNILSCNVASCLTLLDELIINGRELGQFVMDFAWYLRNVLLIKTSDRGKDMVDVSSENLVLLQEDAKAVEEDILIRYIRILSELSNQMRYAVQKRVLLEVTLVKLCKPQMDSTQQTEQLINRIANLEKQIETGAFTVVQTAAGAAAADSVMPQGGQEAQEEKKKPLPKAVTADVRKVVEDWNIIMAGIFPSLSKLLEGVTKTVDDNGTLILLFDDETAESSFSKDEEHMDSLHTAINEHVGKNVPVVTKLVGTKEKDSFLDLSEFIHFDNIEVE